ncbi:MAG: SDR family oxidoreductase [Ectothiorhodospiraceae bacterium]|jgi:NAD(P)-dependent dehydrogenase (short-subunit alcohol dehydrogenase family)|nr:SDR family oxidoreductase [Ectothiorhodospiraceae bacterium]
MTHSVLVTGAGRGIGLEFIRQYLAAGWRVHACARQPERSQALRELAAAHRDRLSVHVLDVANAAHVANLKATLGKMPLDLLINNAGLIGGEHQSFGDVDEATWIETLRVNTFAPLRLMEALADNVAASEQRRIANITSKMGSIDDNGSGGYYIYRTSKAALNMLTKSAAIDLAPRGITCVVLHPGWVRTEMGGPGAEITPEESVTNLRAIIDRLTPAQSGWFFDVDGSVIPW